MSTRERPGGVTLVVVLGYLSGLLTIVGGVLIFLNRHDHALHKDSGLSRHELAIYGGGLLVLGVIVLIVVRALGQGRNWARIVVGLVMLVRIATGIFELIRFPHVYAAGVGLDLAASAVVFYLLMISRRDRAFFDGT
jgi:hypothetical protein